jgi:hypothetical protein
MTVAEIEPQRALVFRQTLPNGAPATWTFVLRPQDERTTRLLSRRRSGEPSLFDRVMRPGYVFMDRGVLHGIRRRVARNAATVSGSVKGYESDRHGKSHRGQREAADTPVP